MSHTDKDRPLWVKRNDATQLRYTEHDHLHLGTPITKRVLLTDEQGEHYKVPYVHKSIEFDWIKAELAGYFDRNLTATERAEFKKVFRDELYSEVTIEREVYATEDVVIGHVPEYCTEGKSVTRETSWWRDSSLPCQPVLTLEHGYYSGWHSRSGVQKVNRRLMRGSERTHTRDILTGYVKEVNASGLDSEILDEFNDDSAPVSIYPVPNWYDYD